MQDGFYLADETHKSITGEPVKLENILYFRQARSGFDSKADKSHVVNYAALFGEFMKLHPDYKLPESFTKEEVGQASVEVKPKPAPKDVEGKKPNQETMDAVAKLMNQPKDGAEKIPKSSEALEAPVNKELESNPNREDIKDPVDAHLAEEEAKKKSKK